MKILVCIDDTDNLESRGTGDLATELAEEIEKRGWGSSQFVTRHQLLVHPDVPYTSHNSSMCFEADIDPDYLQPLIDYASEYLKRESAPGSDPGLCVAVVDRLTDTGAVMAFGRKAKEEVLNKGMAYDLAAELDVHLSEHGGTGQGVVGALAGIGLRMSGKDGRMKGWLKISTDNGLARVGDILMQSSLRGVRTMDGKELGHEETIAVDEKPKAVMIDGGPYLMVSPVDDGDGVRWRTTPRQQLKRF
ncbi:hypothetical protein Pcar_2393 [Syntrophotalea carbinolica DSM 2380]|uniref:tRNA(Ile2) 2-agmatinylcytidine synthetase n=1 Tax=Syntrophotalea carbinolica (strain DSM 2380 / NBRC 103641 / GraBd1) TaxID=338963 RepID=Q3A1X5_SYNC1|nr:hypothetical protein [Syntrophotalea carbinolica]ABA89632.1 hypothetical protein Pcar_2393 [Syntrophotalea carbinolica DSM 2380]